MNIALIFAGGSGQRMNADSLPKQFLVINGKPILIHTLEKFDKHPEIDSIVISCKEDWIDRLQKMVRQFSINKISSIVPGGKTGQESIRNGLLKASSLFSGDSIVLIHDGVRPLIDSKTISANIESVKKYGSAVTVTPAMETIGVIDDDQKIREIIKRQQVMLCRAPQSFYLHDVVDVHLKAIENGINDVTDTATLMKNYGWQLNMIEGPMDNIKITTQRDFYALKSLFDLHEYCQLLRKN